MTNYQFIKVGMMRLHDCALIPDSPNKSDWQGYMAWAGTTAQIQRVGINSENRINAYIGRKWNRLRHGPRLLKSFMLNFGAQRSEYQAYLSVRS